MKRKMNLLAFLALLLTAALLLPLTASGEVTIVEVTKGASVRATPGFNGDKLLLATAGSQYKYLGTEGSWYKVQLDASTTGYLPQDSCKLTVLPGVPLGSAEDAFSSIIGSLKANSFEPELPETFAGKTVIGVYYDLNGRAEEYSTVVFDPNADNRYDYWTVPKELLAEQMADADWALLVYPTLPTGEDTPIGVNIFAVDVKNAVYYAPYTMDDRVTLLADETGTFDMAYALEGIRDSIFQDKWVRAQALANDENYQAGLRYMNEQKYYSAYESFSYSSLEEAAEMMEKCIQPWPYTGEIWHNSSVRGGNTELRVKVNQNNDCAMLVRIYRKNGEQAACLFIGGTGEATAKLPAGTYIIKDGTGTNWFGLKESFGRYGSYETMTFSDNNDEEVELQAGYRSTITVNVTESNPEATGVGSEYEDWEGFTE